MVNPQTGKIASYEEIWRDEDVGEVDTVLFAKNTEGTTWRARVGRWQVTLGRGTDGIFGAWRVEKCEEGWKIMDLTDNDKMKLLLEGHDLAGWVEGTTVEWDAEEWVVLERGSRS